MVGVNGRLKDIVFPVPSTQNIVSSNSKSEHSKSDRKSNSIAGDLGLKVFGLKYLSFGELCNIKKKIQYLLNLLIYLHLLR